MKTPIILLRIAGTISLLFMLFHCAFYKIFQWNTALSCLSQLNLSIMLTYHFISILITGFMGFITLFQAKTLLNSPLKYSILGMFSLFFLIRIITEFSLFTGVHSVIISVIIISLCAIPVIFYMIALFYKSK